MNIYGGNSGYVGYSESVRAAYARSEGKFPKTAFKKYYGISEKKFNELAAREIIYVSEWHHVSKYGNKVDFWAIDEEREPLFWLLIGKKDLAFKAYKETRDYSATTIKNNPVKSYERKKTFLFEAGKYAMTENLNINDTFIYKNQKILICRKTKRKHIPVCRFAKQL